MLYRHWTLFDSLFHSDFVSTRLGTWTSETLGKQKLETLLVTMGIPLKQSLQRCACGPLPSAVCSPPCTSHAVALRRWHPFCPGTTT